MSDCVIIESTGVKVKKQVEEERERQIAAGKEPQSPLNLERNKTYDRLVLVQEDLLHHVRAMKVGIL